MEVRVAGCPTCEAQNWWALDMEVFLLCSGSRTKHIKYVIDAAVAGRKVVNFGWYLDAAAALWDGLSKVICRKYGDCPFHAGIGGRRRTGMLHTLSARGRSRGGMYRVGRDDGTGPFRERVRVWVLSDHRWKPRSGLEPRLAYNEPVEETRKRC